MIILQKFHRDLPPTEVFVFGTSKRTATVPGPTVEALRGLEARVTWLNHQPDQHLLPWDPSIHAAKPRYGGVPTVVHLHGGIDEPSSDGHLNAWFTNGFKETGPAWSGPVYTYPN